MSNKNAQPELVPRLRFPEFRDNEGWASLTVADAVKTVTPPKKLKTSQYGEAGSYPVIDQSPDAICGWTNDEEAVIRKPLPAIVFGDHTCVIKKAEAPFAQGADGIKILVGRGGFDTDFLYQLLCSRPLKSESYKRHFTKLKLVETPRPPSPAEQRKIANCLGSLDDLIAAEGRKLEALRDHKKGLMQQLFPREGETRPRLRFPEFQDAPEWEPRSIEQVCAILNNRRVPITSSDRVPGPYPYYGASGIVDYVDDYIFDERLVLVGEDGAKWKAFEPTAFIADGKYWVNNHAHVLKPIGLIDTLLANYLTLLDIGGYVTGAAPPKLTLRKLKTIPIPVPPTDDEQHRIADCLASLDAMIAGQAEKLDALRTHKHGLMQQLFPSPEDAAA